jgi:hypothetical protein
LKVVDGQLKQLIYSGAEYASQVKSSQVSNSLFQTAWKIHFVTSVTKRKDKSVGNYLQNYVQPTQWHH